MKRPTTFRLVPVPTLGRYLLHARLMWRSARGWSLVCLLLSVIAPAARTGTFVTIGGLVGALPAAVRGGAGSAAAGTAWAWFSVTAVLLLVAPVASALLTAAAQTVSARYLVTFLDMTMEVGSHPYGISHLEDPASAGRLAALAQASGDWLFLVGVDVAWEYLAIRLGGLGAFGILLSWNWWAALAGAAGWLVLSRGFASWSGTLFDELLEVTGNDRRRAGYFHSVLTGGAAAKEVRLFGLASWLAERYAAAWTSAMGAVWANRARGLRATFTALLAPIAANVLLLGLIAYDARTGAMTAGRAVTLVQAVLALEAFGPQNDQQTALARTTSAVADLVRVRHEYGLPTLAAPAAAADARTPRAGPRPALIELRDVGFRYPSRDTATLAGLNLRIPPGQSVAVVGLNGAGKSTLIKLLCGLYRPDSGTVEIDGADPAAGGPACRRVATIFQDFVRYQLSLRDNVGVGAPRGVRDDALLNRALSDAGAGDLAEHLASGWDTVLSSGYTGGTDLSGGQWQRVALARALAALGAGAGVLVLDEPTAAMDVRAEAALFERFLEVTRGATTLLVSHRLSSVRHAERILVLGDAGDGTSRIVEDGTHDELLAAGGRYAELFALQADRFTRTGEAR